MVVQGFLGLCKNCLSIYYVAESTWKEILKVKNTMIIIESSLFKGYIDSYSIE